MKENYNTYLRLLQAAKKVFRELFKQLGDNLVAAYIYGSVARGDCVESSDVDLHIVLKIMAKLKIYLIRAGLATYQSMYLHIRYLSIKHRLNGYLRTLT